MDAPTQSIQIGAGRARRLAPTEVRARATVCVLSDDARERAGIVEMLSISGYDVMAFETSDEFLSAQLPPGPHCMVLDLWLSEQARAELQAELARRGLTMPMVLMAGRGETTIGMRSMSHDAIDVLLKPFTATTLFAAVKQALSVDAR
jgi:FixJ family two-component response regulator